MSPDDAVPGIVIKHTLDELPALILASVARSVQGIIDIGNYLLEAKAQLGHGEFGPWCTGHLPFSVRTAQRYMAIAEDPVIGELDSEGKATHGSHLPPSWRTIYELTCCQDKPMLKAALESGILGPGTERSEATHWVAEVNSIYLASAKAPGKPGTGSQDQDENPALDAAVDAKTDLANELDAAHPATVETGSTAFEDLWKNPPEVWEVVRDAILKLPQGQRKLLAEWLVTDPGMSTLLASLTGPAAGTVEVGGAVATWPEVHAAIEVLKAPGGISGQTPLTAVLKGNPLGGASVGVVRYQWGQRWHAEPVPKNGKALVLAYLEKLVKEES